MITFNSYLKEGINWRPDIEIESDRQSYLSQKSLTKYRLPNNYWGWVIYNNFDNLEIWNKIRVKFKQTPLQLGNETHNDVWQLAINKFIDEADNKVLMSMLTHLFDIVNRDDISKVKAKIKNASKYLTILRKLIKKNITHPDKVTNILFKLGLIKYVLGDLENIITIIKVLLK